jgi:hypothetical protein
MDNVTEANRKVREEMVRYRAALPGLLARYGGRWVVFKDGKVVSDHDTIDDAHAAGVEAFGVFGGQVVIQVAEEKPLYINAGAALFGAQ